MDTTFKVQNFDKILVIHPLDTLEDDHLVGFHTEKIEVGRLSNDILLTNEAQQALNAWSNEPSPAPVRQKSEIRAITINVTQVCNLHCTYCAAGGDGSYGDPIKKISIEKTLPQVQFFLDKITSNSDFRITFLGGEPLLYPEAIEMISDHALALASSKNIKIKFVIVTNGTLFTDKTIRIIKKIRPDITISLDGAPDINDKNRPTKGGLGSTQKVIDGLRLLLDSRSELGQVGLSGVFGDMNSNLETAYRYYSKFPVDWFDFTYDHTEVRSNISQNYMMALEKVAAIAYAKGGEKELRRIKFFDTYFKMLDSQTKTENFCGAGKTYLIADARNDLYTCPWTVGDKKESVGTGTDLWQDKLLTYQDPLIEKSPCQSCWARYLCGGGCMYMHKNMTGSKNNVDENFCDRTRYLLILTILYYEKCRRRQNE